MIATVDLKKQYSARTLFEGVSVQFKSGCRYGLIGANGVGKSTFMKIMAGQEESTKGDVVIDKNRRLAYLRQDHYIFDEQSIMDTVFQGHPEFWKVHEEREHLIHKHDLTDMEGLRASELEMVYADMDGYSSEANAGELLEGLGFPTHKHLEKMKNLSGGFKVRVLLAQALFANPDILLLDEPTNHLDLETIAWIEKLLLSHSGTLVVISHDRHFLNAICTHIADLDYNALRVYVGNYDQYMEASTLAREQIIQDNERKKEEAAKLQQFVNRFSANASKAKQATSRQKLIEKIQIEHIKPSSRKSPFIRFPIGKTLGDKVATCENLSKSFNGLPPLFKKVHLRIAKNDRIAILGQNGIGKTTLLKTLIQKLKPDTGNVVWGETARITYFPQDPAEMLVGDMSLMDWLRQDLPERMDDQELRGLLGRMLFKKDDALKSISVLSGGEKARLILSKMMALEGNVLVLDEPTNHLDLEAIEALNYALEEFSGPILFVSHDRQFVASLATRILKISAGNVEDYSGSFEEYYACARLACARLAAHAS
jgi:ATPase subunit of ABC transporter with duplicated ATPase domains